MVHVRVLTEVDLLTELQKQSKEEYCLTDMPDANPLYYWTLYDRVLLCNCAQTQMRISFMRA